MGTLALDLIRSENWYGYDWGLYYAVHAPEETQLMNADTKANLLSWIGNGDPSIELKIVDVKWEDRPFGCGENFCTRLWFCTALHILGEVPSAPKQS